MKNVSSKIRTIIAIGLLAFAVSSALAVPFAVFAQSEENTKEAEADKARALEASVLKRGTNVTGQSGNPETPNVSCWANFSCWLLKALNLIVDGIFKWPFDLAEVLFSWAIKTNLSFFDKQNPGGLVVGIGFPLVLSVANMFFVLILLWVAIATIFDFEQFTARQLLPKIIIAALLINFSLPIGKVFINLSNGIAQVFYSNMLTLGNNSIRGAITKMFNAGAVYKNLVDPYKAGICEGLTDSACQQAIFRNTAAWSKEAGRQVTALECDYTFSGLAKKYYTECDSLVSNAKQEYEKIPKDADDRERLLASMLISKILVYLIAMFVLFAGAILLFIRTLALVFVLILGPIAFLLFILPQTHQYWSMWWDRLFKWSFFFPVFLFFFWLGLAMITKLDNEFVTINFDGASQLNAMNSLIVYFFSAAFMIGALIISNMLGIQGAAMVTGWGKKMAGGVGGWAKSKGISVASGVASGLAIGAGGAIAGGILGSRFGQRIASSKFARGLNKPLESMVAAKETRKAALADKEMKRKGLAAKASPQYRRALMKSMSADDEADFTRGMKKHEVQQVLGVMSPAEQAAYLQRMKKHELGGKVMEGVRDHQTMTDGQKADFVNALDAKDQADFIRPMKEHELQPILAAMGQGPAGFGKQRELYQRMENFDLEDKVTGAIKDLTRVIEVETNVRSKKIDLQTGEETAEENPQFQPVVNNWFKSASREDLQKHVKAEDLRNNTRLRAAIEQTADANDLKNMINTGEKAAALRDHFIAVGGKQEYDADVAKGASPEKAAGDAFLRAAKKIENSNAALARDLGTPVFQVNLARGLPISRKTKIPPIVEPETPPSSPPPGGGGGSGGRAGGAGGGGSGGEAGAGPFTA